MVAKGADVLVREYTLDPGEAIPWHRHSEVSDYYCGLEGRMVIETRDPVARHEVGAGQFATVTPRTAHRPIASCSTLKSGRSRVLCLARSGRTPHDSQALLPRQ